MSEPEARASAKRSLPRLAKGLGLRPALYRELEVDPLPVDYLEAITENFLVPRSRTRIALDRMRERYPIVLHGVGLNLLGHEPLDERYLDEVAALADAIDAPFVTDHLCWTAAHGVNHHDLLPVPFVEELIELAAERAAFVQKRLGRPFGLENLSSYLAFKSSTFSEHEFYAEVVRRSACWFMLDVNNIYVSSVNLGFDANRYLDAIDFERVLQVHLAGHRKTPEGILVDTHDSEVSEPVWELYAEAWRRGGPFPTLLEWDSEIPGLDVLLAQLRRADEVRG